MTVDPRAYGVGVPQRPSDERHTQRNLRCSKCDKLLAELVSAPWQIRCPRCKLVNTHESPGTVAGDKR